MEEDIFSWQLDDYIKLQNAFTTSTKILLIHGRDFESPYHVVSSFYTRLSKDSQVIFSVFSDSNYLSYPYLPFTQAINREFEGSSIKRSLLPSIIRDIAQLDTIAEIAEEIIDEQHVSIVLSERENELLLRMERIASNNNSVFFMRDFNNFDINSQKLTSLLLSGQLDDDFPFLKKTKFLFLCETEDDSSFVLQHISLFEHIDINLVDPLPGNISEILLEICPNASFLPEEQNKIFYLSGGRLSVIEILSQYLQSNGQSIIDQSIENVVHSTLDERISKMGKLGTNLENILAVAASIGSTFDIPLLRKATDPASCKLALKKSDDELFTKCSEKTGKFIYREIWEYFNSCISIDKKQEIAKTLERAIYYFDPYDYLIRAHYFEQAGFFHDACELYIFAYNSLYLEGITPDDNLSIKISTLSKQCGVEKYWDDLCQVYSSMKDLDYNTCVHLLEDMTVPSGKRLLLLKEYLAGLCQHKYGRTSEQQREAILTMEMAAEHASTIEEGLWCDCLTALISFWMNGDGNITAAKKAWKELTYYYTEKSFSRFAQKGLHALERKWSSIFSVERSVSKTEESVNYFRNGYYPSQYLMALNNHSANLILLGRNDEAMDYLDEAISTIKLYPNISVNRMYLLSNYILCKVLRGELQPEVAYQKLLPMMEKQEFGDWVIIFKLNCAIYMALSGKISSSKKILHELEHIIQDINDDYYLFYVYANLAAILYLQGNSKEAVQMLKDQCSKAPTLFKATEKVQIEERTRQWVVVMEHETIDDPKAFDSFLLNKDNIQPQWSFWKHGFLYSDIQFWSEG